MAEVIARDLLRDTPGAEVASAGVSALDGGPATPPAVAAAAELGLELADHRSQPVTAVSVDRADHVWTMTGAHLDLLLARFPEAAGKAETLDPDADVADPIGGSLGDYRVTAEQIKTALLRRLGGGGAGRAARPAAPTERGR